MWKDEKRIQIKERVDKSISKLKELSIQLSRYPTADEYDKNKGEGYFRRDLEKHLGKSFYSIEKEYCQDLVCPQREKRYYDKEEIISRIRNYFESIDHSPTMKELLKSGLPYYKTINRIFDGMSYLELINSLGYKIKGTTTKAYSKEKMLKDFRDYYYRTGRYITHSNGGDADQKCFATYVKMFGSMENICKLAGVPYSLKNISCGTFGKYVVDLNNELCQSVVEKEITDYFILNKIPYEKEYKYSNLIPDCKYIFDWRIEIGGKYFYVEYCGLYDENAKLESIKKYTNKVQCKIKTLKENNLYDNSIFIFPKDYNGKSVAEIFETYI